MKLPRRNFLLLAAGAAALPPVSRIARAQDRPSRPVRIIERTPSRVDLNVAPFRPSKLLETLAERGQVVMKFCVVLGMRH